MTRSMTAYARVTSKPIRGFSYVVELHSINRKMLDVHMHLGRELLFLDIPLRKVVAAKIHRGLINVKVHHSKGEKIADILPFLKKLKSRFEKITKELKLPQEEITLPFLMQQLQHLSLEDEMGADLEKELKKVLEQGLKQLIVMKEKEGEALAKDLVKRLKAIHKHILAIRKMSAGGVERYKEKLLKRLELLFSGEEIDDKIAREVALYAEKIDITEEVVRLESHLKQMQDLFVSKTTEKGKTLEFLTQEMGREINTIAAKSGELGVTQLAVEVKSELEKIREQVQNIE